MRRIIFGAIWLTGFLAVLLAWGMMWGRAQGEGPGWVWAIVYDNLHNHDYLALVAPDSHKYWSLETFQSGGRARTIGWSADGNWFYYQIESQVKRISNDLRRRELLFKVRSGSDQIQLSPDTRYIIYRDELSNHVFSYNIADHTSTNLSASFVDSYLKKISPDSRWLVLQTQDTQNRWAWYQVGIEGDFQSHLFDLSLFAWREFLCWSNLPEWIILLETNLVDGDTAEVSLYRVRPDGGDLEVFAANKHHIPFTAWVRWVHQDGIVGILDGDTFSAIWVDTGQILWTVTGVEDVYNDHDWDAIRNLNNDWVYFKMTDGRLARRRFDGSGLTFYDTHGLPNWRVWGWSPDGEWVWFETTATNPELVDIIRVQANSGLVELMIDEIHWGAIRAWSPDDKWVYYYDKQGRLSRVAQDGKGKSETVLDDEYTIPLTFTPPYQAEWQPTHTLAIGIGLMSLSTLTPIVLWRRRDKPRITKAA